MTGTQREYVTFSKLKVLTQSMTQGHSKVTLQPTLPRPAVLDTYDRVELQTNRSINQPMVSTENLTVEEILSTGCSSSIVMRSDQPKPPAVAIVRQNGLSSASCRASVAATPVSRQIWWIQVVGDRPLARLHSCKGQSPSLVLVQIRRIWFAGTSEFSCLKLH